MEIVLDTSIRKCRQITNKTCTPYKTIRVKTNRPSFLSTTRNGYFNTQLGGLVVSSNPTEGGAYSIQLYVIKFVRVLWVGGGFLRVRRLPPPIKLTII